MFQSRFGTTGLHLKYPPTNVFRLPKMMVTDEWNDEYDEHASTDPKRENAQPTHPNRNPEVPPNIVSTFSHGFFPYVVPQWIQTGIPHLLTLVFLKRSLELDPFTRTDRNYALLVYGGMFCGMAIAVCLLSIVDYLNGELEEDEQPKEPNPGGYGSGGGYSSGKGWLTVKGSYSSWNVNRRAQQRHRRQRLEHMMRRASVEDVIPPSCEEDDEEVIEFSSTDTFASDHDDRIRQQQIAFEHGELDDDDEEMAGLLGASVDSNERASSQNNHTPFAADTSSYCFPEFRPYDPMLTGTILVNGGVGIVIPLLVLWMVCTWGSNASNGDLGSIVWLLHDVFRFRLESAIVGPHCH